jgi:RNA 2',3'-cyclic 3'-phosphodiesterase
MKLIRSFIAIEYPPAIKQAILAVISQGKTKIHPGLVRWIPENNLHITLKFLGEVEESKLADLKNLITESCHNFPSFPISIEGSGVFPNPSRPRILWIGSGECPEVIDLVQRLEQLASRIGVQPQEKPFTPHLTIGRVAKDLSDSELRMIGEAYCKIPVGKLGEMVVDHITLFRSDLDPHGAKYSIQAVFPLKVQSN